MGRMQDIQKILRRTMLAAQSMHAQVRPCLRVQCAARICSEFSTTHLLDVFTILPTANTALSIMTEELGWIVEPVRHANEYRAHTLKHTRDIDEGWC